MLHIIQTLIYISSLAEELISQLSDSQVKYISDNVKNKNHELMHQNRIIDVTINNKGRFRIKDYFHYFYVDIFHKHPHNNQNNKKTDGVCVFLCHHHVHFNPQLGQGKCTISFITYLYRACTNHFDLTWSTKFHDDKQPRCYIPRHYVYSNLLVN